MSPDRTDIVCLCTHYDLKSLYATGFAHHPSLQLLQPEEVADPKAIDIALAFNPPPDAFARFPNLKLLHSVGAGVDGLLKHPGLLPGMAVVRMVNPEQARMMAGFAVWHVVSWHRRLWEYPALQAKRHWEVLDASAPSRFPVAVLGWGNMGRACGEALAGLGYPVTAWAGTPRTEAGIRILAGAAGLEEVLAEARVVVNVLPLTAATQGILDARRFAMMRDDALVVQLGRGGHLVEADLVAALDAGRPAMAALDVMETEPLPAESPLWAHPRIRVTPHCASESSAEAVADAVAANIERWKSGEPMRGVVDRARGY
ncbi:MAG: glyoxylate/hydroxypyruvate reductase A [Pseudomonadota bacterium]